MTIDWLIVTALWGVITTVWGVLLFEQRRLRRDGLLLKPLPRVHVEETEPLPRLCVIVPTRNAGASIRDCIESILGQDYDEMDILIVDDRSTDETGAVIDSIASSDTRVRAIHIDVLPPGWLGKSHALWNASKHTTADWLLFLDDDCRLDPPAVRTALHEARQRGADLLSLWPRHAGGTFAEHLIIPLCGGIIAMWFGRRRRDGSPARAFANGQFLLIKRDSYEKIGGHQSVKNALIEDVVLARHAAESDIPAWVASGASLFSVRMYDGFSQTMDGWTRIFTGALRSGTRLMLSVLWLLAGSLTPFLLLPVLVTLLWGDFVNHRALDPGMLAAFGQGVIHLVLMMLVSYRFWGFGRCSRAYLWLYPVSAILVIILLLRAWWWLMVRRTVRWRGTDYAIDRNARIVC